MKYRLKPEALQFFKEEYATRIEDMIFWKTKSVDVKALEEIREPYLSYGMQESTIKSLCGWNPENGSEFKFTIYFPSVKHQEFDRFSNGRNVRKLMDQIQGLINDYYVNYHNESE